MYKYQNQDNLTIFLLTLLECLAATLIFYFISVSFGASLIEDFQATLFFSGLLTLLCILPALIVIEHTNPLDVVLKLFSHDSGMLLSHVEQRCKNVAIGAMVGAWVGALVIPLDWDRWWQQWPVSCCFGALSGTVIGLLGSTKSDRTNKRHI